MLPSFSRNGRFTLESPFQALHDSLNRALYTAEPEPASGRTGVYPVDIREDATSFYVDAELPGFTREQIEVTLDKGVLEIVATRGAAPASNEAGDGQPRQETHLQERRYTRVARAFKLPSSVDESKIQAKLENGVLYLVLTKREEIRPRKIEIR